MLHNICRPTCFVATLFLLITPIIGAADEPVDGVLDKPHNVGLGQEALRSELESELEELKKLSPEELQSQAQGGVRAAQLLVGEAFAKEAAGLSFAPEAANAAASDAARWYSLAAMSGFPGAPPLDFAGVKVYPFQVQRSR